MGPQCTYLCAGWAKHSIVDFLHTDSSVYPLCTATALLQLQGDSCQCFNSLVSCPIITANLLLERREQEKQSSSSSPLLLGILKEDQAVKRLAFHWPLLSKGIILCTFSHLECCSMEGAEFASWSTVCWNSLLKSAVCVERIGVLG